MIRLRKMPKMIILFLIVCLLASAQCFAEPGAGPGPAEGGPAAGETPPGPGENPPRGGNEPGENQNGNNNEDPNSGQGGDNNEDPNGGQGGDNNEDPNGSQGGDNNEDPNGGQGGNEITPTPVTTVTQAPTKAPTKTPTPTPTPTPVPNGKARATATKLPTITIDGEKDAAWKVASTAELKNVAYGENGATAEFQVLRDTKRVYFFITVKDATPDTDSEIATRKDGVELFLSFDSEKHSDYRFGVDMHYRIMRDGTVKYESGANPDALEYKVVADASGYRIELAVMPSTDYFPELTMIGFDLHVNDSFGNAMRDFILTWSDTSLMTFTDLSKIGTVWLSNVTN